MSPAAYKVLSAAYENYKNTGNRHFAYYASGIDDWFDALAGTRQLHQDKLIHSDLYYIADSSVRVVPDVTAPFTFRITEMGIEGIRSKRDSEG